MKIAVISDTHRNKIAIEIVSSQIKDVVDEIFHLGDNVADALAIENITGKKVHYVRGNMDPWLCAPANLVLEFMDKRFFMTHGDEYDVKMSIKELIAEAEKREADCVLFGHTHYSEQFKHNDILFVNPGSAGEPRMAISPTYAILHLSENGIYVEIVRF